MRAPDSVRALRSERIRLILAVAAVIPAGLAVKFCVPGTIGRWCTLYGAAVLYEVLWVLVLRLAVPRMAPVACGGIVLTGTCVLEFLQLWHPPFLEAVRRTFLGAAILGQSFDPWDFPHYVLGSAFGAGLVRVLRNAD